MQPTIKSLRAIAKDLSIALPSKATRRQIIEILRPDSTDNSLDAHMLREQLGLLPTSPSEKSPLVHKIPARAPPPVVHASVHVKRRPRDDDEESRATQVRRLINVMWQLH